MDVNLVKSEPFTCYFCNNLIENDTQSSHMAVCGHVLEPCPNRCGSYIQRNMKNVHIKECLNNYRKSSLDLRNLNGTQDLKMTSQNTKAATLDRIPKKNSSSIDANSSRALWNIHTRLNLLEEDLHKINISKLNKQQEEIATIKTVCSNLRAAIEKSQLQNQVFSEWKKHIETLFESFRSQSKFSEDMKRQNDYQMRNIESRMVILDKILRDIKMMEGNMTKEQLYNREEHNELKAKVEELRDFCLQENATISAIWNDQKANIEALTDGLNITNKTVDDFKLKHSALVFDVRTINQIAEEASEKVEILENKVEELRKKLLEVRSDVQNLEQSCSFQPNLEKVGRCLWIVSELSAKMKTAKEVSVVLKGPTFYTHEYGYKVRLLVYANGLNKWKGRHLLATLHVLKGEYDLILKWPCNIEAEVTVRDLLDSNAKKDITKKIVVKKLEGDEENEDPDESSLQYVFVPHTTLFKENYIRDDKVFLDIKIIQRTGLETLL